MTFTETKLPGVWIIDVDILPDERGFFGRTWAREEFETRGLSTEIAHASLAFNHRRGTIRGMHAQSAPFEEVKLVRVVRGAVFDVVVDLRPGSPTFKQWVGVELTQDNRAMLYVPAGFAHGYQTLTDDAEVFYLISAPYAPSHAIGVRWNDPAFGIDWPLGAPAVIHPRDASYPDFS
jgi:dTDP-4-dehydrorhamnose 3,5-epimerase